MADSAVHHLPASRASAFRVAPLRFDLPRLDCSQTGWLGSLALHAAAALLLALNWPVQPPEIRPLILVSLTPEAQTAPVTRVPAIAPAARIERDTPVPESRPMPVQPSAAVSPRPAPPVLSAPENPLAATPPVAVAQPAPPARAAVTDTPPREAAATAVTAAIAPTASTPAAPAPRTPAAPAAAGSGPTGAAPPVTAPLFNAAYLNNPAPGYPASSRRLREEGQVVLRVLVNTQGRAEQIELRSGSGFARLDESARAAVSRWTFVPARRGEQAVPAWVVVPLTFRLNA